LQRQNTSARSRTVNLLPRRPRRTESAKRPRAPSGSQAGTALRTHCFAATVPRGSGPGRSHAVLTASGANWMCWAVRRALCKPIDLEKSLPAESHANRRRCRCIPIATLTLPLPAARPGAPASTQAFGAQRRIVQRGKSNVKLSRKPQPCGPRSVSAAQ
jgi:hypothetical protein